MRQNAVRRHQAEETCNGINRNFSPLFPSPIPHHLVIMRHLDLKHRAYLRCVIGSVLCAAALLPVTTGWSQELPPSAPQQVLLDASNRRIQQPMELARLTQSLSQTHTARILAIGSSSTAGVGASSPSRSYVARLESDLEADLKGTDFEVIGHGLSGELAQGAADRMKREVEEVKPDLVIWQVGTNDATRHVAMDQFKNCLRKTLAWLREQKIDVILINPQYGEALVKDAYYEQVVLVIADIAKETQVLLVDRFDAMRELQRARGSHVDLSTDNLHMNDEGFRRLAEQVAATIIRALPHHAPANVASFQR